MLAAATENLKNLNQLVDRDGERESEDFGDRDSIMSFSRPFSKVPEVEDETGRDSPPAIEYSLPPRRASIRMASAPPPGDSNGSKMGAPGRRQSLSQSTPLSAAELRRGTRLSTVQPFSTDEEHAQYTAASARAAQETVEAMTSLYHDPMHDMEGEYSQDYPPAPEEGQGYSEEYYQQGDGAVGEYGAYGNEYGTSYGQDYEQNYQGCVSFPFVTSLIFLTFQRDQSHWQDEQAPEELPDDLPPIEEQPMHTRQKSSLALFSGGSILGEYSSRPLPLTLDTSPQPIFSLAEVSGKQPLLLPKKEVQGKLHSI